MPSTRQAGLPVAASSATSDSLSMLALTTTRFLTTTGEAAEPQPWVRSPTSACQSFSPPRL